MRGAPGAWWWVDEYGCSVCAAMGIDRGYGWSLVVTSDHGDPAAAGVGGGTWWSCCRCCRGRCEWTGWPRLAVVVM